jgi:hypothetical protein
MTRASAITATIPQTRVFLIIIIKTPLIMKTLLCISDTNFLAGIFKKSEHIIAKKFPKARFFYIKQKL